MTLLTQALIVILMCIFVRSLHVFDQCFTSSHCPDGSTCTYRGCAGQLCLCNEDLLPDRNRTRCIQGVDLGSTCTRFSVCEGQPFSDCIDNICQCKDGYRQSLTSNSVSSHCLPLAPSNDAGSEFVDFGETCNEDNKHCSFDLVCNNGTCTCPDGQRLATKKELAASPFSYLMCRSTTFQLGVPVDTSSSECQKPEPSTTIPTTLSTTSLTTTTLPTTSPSTSTSSTLSTTTSTTTTTTTTTSPTTTRTATTPTTSSTTTRKPTTLQKRTTQTTTFTTRTKPTTTTEPSTTIRTTTQSTTTKPTTSSSTVSSTHITSPPETTVLKTTKAIQTASTTSLKPTITTQTRTITTPVSPTTLAHTPSEPNIVSSTVTKPSLTSETAKTTVSTLKASNTTPRSTFITSSTSSGVTTQSSNETVKNVGDPCSGHNCPNNSVCEEDVCGELRCRCSLGYAQSPDGLACFKLAALGESCRDSRICQGPFTECTEDGICDCQYDYERSDTGKWCRLKSRWLISFPLLGESCSGGFFSSCYMDFEQDCVESRCKCKQGSREVGDDDRFAMYPDIRQCRNSTYNQGDRDKDLCKNQSKQSISTDLYDKAKARIRKMQAAIIGGSVGFLVLVGIIIGLIVLIRWKRRGRRQVIRDTSSMASSERYSFKIPRPFTHYVGAKEYDSQQIAYPNPMFQNDGTSGDVTQNDNTSDVRPDVLNVSGDSSSLLTSGQH